MKIVSSSVCALAGCPLILTDMEVVEKVDSLSKAEREFLCSLLFYTINWFREVSAPISPSVSYGCSDIYYTWWSCSCLPLVSVAKVTNKILWLSIHWLESCVCVLYILCLGSKCILQAERPWDEDEGCNSSSEHHLPADNLGDVLGRY